MRLTILFLLLAQILFGQTSAPLNPVLKFQISNPGSTGTYPNFTVSGFVSDDLGRWDALNVSVGDSLYLLNGSDLIVSVITTINSAAGNSLNITVNCKNPGTSSLDPGQAVIVHPTLTYQFPTFTSGLRSDLQAAVMNRFSQLVEEQLYDADEIAFTTGSVPPNNSVATSQGYRLAKNQSGNGDLYSWNGSAWVLAGGSVSVPAPRIPYGTGSGITSTPAMRFDSIPTNGQYTQRVFTIGDTVTTTNQRLESIVIDNTYGRNGTGGLGKGWVYSPLVFKSPTKCVECTDFTFQRHTSTNQVFPNGHPDTTLNEVVMWGHNISGSQKPNQPGMWYAMEPNWYNGGQRWHEYHLEFYNPLFGTPAFISQWGNNGLSRRLFTTEIQNSQSVMGMTNTWQSIADVMLQRSLKSNTQYSSVGYDEISKDATSVLYSANGTGVRLRSSGNNNMTYFENVQSSGYGGLSFGKYSTLNFTDHNNKNIFSWSGSSNEMNFGQDDKNLAGAFRTQTINGGWGFGIVSDHTNNPSFPYYGHFVITSRTNGNNRMYMGVYTPNASSVDSSYTYISSAETGKGMRFQGKSVVFGPAGINNSLHTKSDVYMTVRGDAQQNENTTGTGKTALRAENNAYTPNATAFEAYTRDIGGKLINLSNTSGTSTLFRSNASPESVITANPGDWCFVNNSGTGQAYLKVSGTGNTGWLQVSTGGVSTVGAFQNTGNANGLSISGTDIRLHAATETQPGGWNNVSQTFGVGNNVANKKTIINTVDGSVTTTFKHWNTGGASDSGVKEEYFVGEGQIGEDQYWIPSGGIGNVAVKRLKDPSGGLVDAVTYTQGTNYSSTEFDGKQKYKITNVTATTYQITGKDVFINIPTTATTTDITLPEIVSGVPSANQVRIGDCLLLKVNKTGAVTFTRSGTDVIITDGASGSNTTFTTTSNVVFAKTIIATGLDEWTIFQ